MKRFFWLALTVFALLGPTAEAQVCPAGSTCSPFESYLQTQNQATAPYGSGLHIPAAPNATAGSLVWIPASDFLTLTGSQTVSGKIINCANNTCTVRLGSDVTGNLSVSNLASGVGASSSTFWRGDGTWAAPPGGGGSPGGSSGNVQFNNGGAFGGLTDAQLTARIQAFTGSLTGAVPASGGGTTNFLRADGTWSTPAGSGNVSAALNLTNNAPVIGDGGTTGIKTTAAMTNGQLLVGVTGSAPAPATMSGDATLAAGGAITIAANAITTGKINNQAVTYAKMQNGASNGLLGVNSAASPTEVAVGSGLNLAGGTLTATGGTVNTGTTNQLAYYASSTSAVSSNAHLSESGSALVVNYNAASLPAATAGTVLQIGGADTANTKLLADAFGTGAVPGMTGRQARGTAASPTASQTGDNLLGFNGLGRGATGYSSNPRASMVFGACENWSDTAQCGNVTFYTTAPTTTTTNAKVAINGDGGVTVNTSAGAAPTGGTQGAGTINVAGGLYINGSAAVAAATPNITVAGGTAGSVFSVGTTVPKNVPADGGSHSYTILSSDLTKQVILASTFTAAAVPQATGSFATGASFVLVTTSAVTATSTTSTINGIAGATGIKLGANQQTVWTSDGTNWNVAVGVPQAATQAGTNCLKDDNTFGTCSGSAGAVTLISTQTASSSADLRWTSIGTANHRELKCRALIPATNGTGLYVQYSEDAGSTWKAASYHYEILANSNAQVFSTYSAAGNSANAFIFSTAGGTDIGELLGNAVANTAPGMSATIDLDDLDSTTANKSIDYRTSWNDGAKLWIFSGSGFYVGDTGKVTGIRVIAGAGNITSGSCSLYNYAS